MRSRSRRWQSILLTSTALGVVVSLTGLAAARAVLFPKVDAPAQVDAIVVVAGANDDRYVYGWHLAEHGATDQILVSLPPGDVASSPLHGKMLNSFCAATPIHARDGRQIGVECFAPDVDTTEGETTAASRIAHERGWKSLLVVTYWGHVSRVRLYIEQCFGGDVYVTDTPRPTQISRRYALLHETGGYAKALVKPAC